MPSSEEMEKFGFTEEDFASDPVDIWPDNLDAFNLFSSIGTQWRVEMSGPSGLDYNVVFHKLDRMNLTPERYIEMEQDIQVMESAALLEMRKEV